MLRPSRSMLHDARFRKTDLGNQPSARRRRQPSASPHVSRQNNLAQQPVAALLLTSDVAMDVKRPEKRYGAASLLEGLSQALARHLRGVADACDFVFRKNPLPHA